MLRSAARARPVAQRGVAGQRVRASAGVDGQRLVGEQPARPGLALGCVEAMRARPRRARRR